MEKILQSANIWDLHIHTSLGTPTKKNYNDISTEEFIDELIDIYDKADNKIGMIYLPITIKLIQKHMNCLGKRVL